MSYCLKCNNQSKYIPIIVYQSPSNLLFSVYLMDAHRKFFARRAVDDALVVMEHKVELWSPSKTPSSQVSE